MPPGWLGVESVAQVGSSSSGSLDLVWVRWKDPTQLRDPTLKSLTHTYYPPPSSFLLPLNSARVGDLFMAAMEVRRHRVLAAKAEIGRMMALSKHAVADDSACWNRR